MNLQTRNVLRHEWLYAWHEMRYGRRNMRSLSHVGPVLREALRMVERMKRDTLIVRQSMAQSCGGRSAFIYTTPLLRSE